MVISANLLNTADLLGVAMTDLRAFNRSEPGWVGPARIAL